MDEKSWGLKIHKRDTSQVVKILKRINIINRRYKLSKSENYVIIPIKSNEITSELDDFEVKLKKHNFEASKKHKNSIKEILVEQIPEDLHEYIPTAFDVIGNIAIIDLKDEMVPYKDLIGKVSIEFNPSIHSVFQKTSKVTGTHRIRELELIGGENKTTTIHKEHGIRFFIDVAKVYFSPRLATEHDRIAKLVNNNEKILDMFCGIAPFAFHILRRVDSDITCIDINPNTANLVSKSLKLNKSITKDPVVLTGDSKKILPEKLDGIIFDRIIMNHPSAAIEYLDLAVNHLHSNGVIHFYTFAPITEMEKYCTNLIKNYNAKIYQIHKVRQSSPSEFHVCIDIKKS